MSTTAPAPTAAEAYPHKPWCSASTCEMYDHAKVSEAFHRGADVVVELANLFGVTRTFRMHHTLAQGGGLDDEEGIHLEPPTEGEIYSPEQLEELALGILKMVTRYRLERDAGRAGPIAYETGRATVDAAMGIDA